ncbi:hypothetical protein LTR94_033499, partial [Friedmanniomyces endolithicus]
MSEAKTGPQRIKGGVPPGWSYLHKTGTGQDLPPRSTGFNDIGIMTAPDGTSYAVAVMIGSTTVGIPERWALMQAVAKAADRGAFVLGICNGFQVLTESGLLPGALLRNAGGHF